MTIGVPKEIKQKEHRVALLPSAAWQLVQRGQRVVVERGAGAGAGYDDAEYLKAGCEIVADAAGVFDAAELIVKVKEPQPRELAMLHGRHTLFTYLHLAADRALTEGLMKSGCTAVAYETVEKNRRLPLLEPMSEIAGRMSVMIGAYFLAKHNGGRGVLLGGVPGVLPGKVLIIGGGTAGMNAAQVATGIGADVTILEVDVERMRFLDITMHTAHTLYSNPGALLEALPDIDLIIGAVLVPGAKAPKLITREMLHVMKPGTVFVDIAIDQGGCAETSRPTTHDRPTFVEEDVIHYCVTNMPGAYARTATQALTNGTFPYVQWLAESGVTGACAKHPELKSGINIQAGRVTNEAVAAAHGLPFGAATI
jgi:alanine dehydrogenase